jgi:hypothetical protein
LACPIEDDTNTFADSGRARDQTGRARDQSNKEPFRKLPGHEYARNYPDPVTGHPLQIYPSKSPRDFDSDEDFWKHKDAVSRWHNGLPPPRPVPAGEDIAPQAGPGRPPRPASRFKPTKSRHLAVRLTEADYQSLVELSLAHAVRPGTMARMLVVRGVRAAAEAADPPDPAE